jgi:hypothetical protein
MKTSKTLVSRLGPALLLAASLVIPSITRAAVKATGIYLSSTTTSYRYVVPEGKVLILEHVAFCDTWTGKPMALRIQFSINPVGPVWTTTMTYSQNWNSLLRPIRIPAGKAAAIDTSYGGNYLCFLYGLLVDEADLYAGVPAAIQGVQVAGSPDGQLVTGHIELQSPQPSHVVVQQTENMNQWQNAFATVQATDLSPAQKTFSVNLPSDTKKAFLRAHGHTGDRLLPP